MTMRLNRLTLQNFKGIKALTIEPKGANMSIFGENGTGKTTIADAYAWVVFGKNFTGDSIEPEIKKRDAGTGLTPNDGGVVHAAEAELALDSGGTFTIRKEYVEKWEKKRGAAESEFRGHTTNYYINGTPMQKKEYDKRVSEVIPEEAGRLLSIPLHFCTNLKWQERRKILMDMCGEVSDKDLFAKEEFAPLAKLLEGKSLDDFRKSTKAQMKKVNEELKAIPERIDELAQLETEAVSETAEEIGKALAELNAKRKDAAEKIARLENGGEVADIKKHLAEVDARMTKFKAEFEARCTRSRGEAESVVRGCTSEIERLGVNVEKIQERVAQLETINATTDEQAQKLREDWAAENAKELDVVVSDVCPCCGQKLPPDKLEEAKEKALADFNRKKSEILTEITAKGKRMMESKAKNAEEIKESRERMEVLTQRIAELADQKAEAEKTLAEPAPDITKENDHKSLIVFRDALMKKLGELEQGKNSDALEEARKEAEAIDADIETANGKMAAMEQVESVKKRKAELMEREKELGETYTSLEKSLDMAERFVRAKVQLTEDAINSHFKHVHFTMFRTQINGGLEECCEPTIDGVPFGTGLNAGGEMKSALDILNALSKHFKLNLPVFIDNCESYTSESLIPIENQLIRLVVAEGQKNLSIEVDGQEKQEISAISRAA